MRQYAKKIAFEGLLVNKPHKWLKFHVLDDSSPHSHSYIILKMRTAQSALQVAT